MPRERVASMDPIKKRPKGSKYHYSRYLGPKSIYYTITWTLWDRVCLLRVLGVRIRVYRGLEFRTLGFRV